MRLFFRCWHCRCQPKVSLSSRSRALHCTPARRPLRSHSNASHPTRRWQGGCPARRRSRRAVAGSVFCGRRRRIAKCWSSGPSLRRAVSHAGWWPHRTCSPARSSTPPRPRKWRWSAGASPSAALPVISGVARMTRPCCCLFRAISIWCAWVATCHRPSASALRRGRRVATRAARPMAGAWRLCVMAICGYSIWCRVPTRVR